MMFQYSFKYASNILGWDVESIFFWLRSLNGDANVHAKKYAHTRTTERVKKKLKIISSYDSVNRRIVNVL